MATHSRILAWKIPWTKEPGELQSLGTQRDGHDLATKPPPPPALRNCTKVWSLCFPSQWSERHTPGSLGPLGGQVAPYPPPLVPPCQTRAPLHELAGRTRH